MQSCRSTIQAFAEFTDGTELEVEVEFEYYGGTWPTRWHPGDPPELEILRIEDVHSGEEIDDWDDIRQKDRDNIEEKAKEVGHDRLQ